MGIGAVKMSEYKRWLEIAKKNGINEDAFYYRVKSAKWDYEKAATKPVNKIDEEFKKWQQIAESNGISYRAFHNRVKKSKWSYEKAATVKPIRKQTDTNNKDIAIYSGDKFLIWGKPREVAEKLGRTVRDVKWLCSPSVRKRFEDTENGLYGIYIEDDEEVTS